MRPLAILFHTVSHNTLTFALRLTLFVLASSFAQFGKYITRDLQPQVHRDLPRSYLSSSRNVHVRT
jgi:hypothetical protein